MPAIKASEVGILTEQDREDIEEAEDFINEIIRFRFRDPAAKTVNVNASDVWKAIGATLDKIVINQILKDYADAGFVPEYEESQTDSYFSFTK